jgi:hypothetical protein
MNTYHVTSEDKNHVMNTYHVTSEDANHVMKTRHVTSEDANHVMKTRHVTSEDENHVSTSKQQVSPTSTSNLTLIEIELIEFFFSFPTILSEQSIHETILKQEYNSKQIPHLHHSLNHGILTIAWVNPR